MLITAPIKPQFWQSELSQNADVIVEAYSHSDTDETPCRFIIVFKIAHQLTISRARIIQSTHSYAISIRSVLILSSQGVPNLLISASKETRCHNLKKHKLGGIRTSSRFLTQFRELMIEIFNNFIHSLGSNSVVISKTTLLLLLSCVSSVIFLDCSHITRYKKT
jgi:hypothetical protein